MLACLGLTAFCALPVTEAGTFNISPLRVDFAGAKATAALTVRNEEATPVVVQTQGLAWSQEAGQDALASSRDLLISPAVFTLPAGGSQLVRVALRRGADPVRELSYRVILQEVPQAASPDFTGLQVSLRLSVPVFVAPLAPAEPRLAWHGTRLADGRLQLTARNDGTAHARVHRFALRTTDGSDRLLEQPGLAYVLPGSMRQWTFDADNNNIRANSKVTTGPAGSGPYRLEGTTDRGAFATELNLAGD
jgi:fimbrial chaperone protein